MNQGKEVDFQKFYFKGGQREKMKIIAHLMDVGALGVRETPQRKGQILIEALRDWAALEAKVGKNEVHIFIVIFQMIQILTE